MGKTTKSAHITERGAFWKDKNVFVTGCTGLLGSWLTKSLVEKGANVVGLVRDLVPHSNLYRFGLEKKINIVKGTIEDYFVLERCINEYEVDTVFHLAAQAIVGAANRNTLSTFEANVRGTWNLLEACRRNQKVKRIIVASSDKAYGQHEKLPYSEHYPLQGTHPYDVSKSCADLISHTYYITYKLPVCVTRCGNIYGGGDLNFNRIIPGTIQSVINNKKPIIRSDGTFVRDYIYVPDIVTAYLLLTEKMDELDIYGEVFNFSNGQPISVKDIVQKILKLMSREDLTHVILNQASNEIKYQYLSSEKASTKLDWKPRYTLNQGLIKTIQWYGEYFKDVAKS
jgi:CDP-glucose 4,6-dehydratase